MAATPYADPRDFSVVLGGPLFQLFRKAHLAGYGLELLPYRSLAVVALTWVPLLALTALEGLALGTKVGVPFLYDIEAQGRFLLFVPLLVYAELLVHQRLNAPHHLGNLEELLHPGQIDAEILDEPLDEAQPFDLVDRIQAHAADRARRLDQPQPLVLAQRLGMHAEHAGRRGNENQLIGHRPSLIHVKYRH